MSRGTCLCLRGFGALCCHLPSVCDSANARGIPSGGHFRSGPSCPPAATGQLCHLLSLPAVVTCSALEVSPVLGTSWEGLGTQPQPHFCLLQPWLCPQCPDGGCVPCPSWAGGTGWWLQDRPAAVAQSLWLCCSQAYALWRLQPGWCPASSCLGLSPSRACGCPCGEGRREGIPVVTGSTGLVCPEGGEQWSLAKCCPALPLMSAALPCLLLTLSAFFSLTKDESKRPKYKELLVSEKCGCCCPPWLCRCPLQCGSLWLCYSHNTGGKS